VVFDAQGKPLPDANVLASIWTEEKGFKATRDYKTDAAGGAQVELPKTFTILRLWASKKPYVTLFSHWEQAELASGKEFPAEYTFRMETGVTAGGRVVDVQGKPIASAKVQVMLAGEPRVLHGDGRTHYNTWLATEDDNNAAKTDADGRWHIDNVPNDPKLELMLMVSHADYVSDEDWAKAQKAASVTTAMLWKGTAVVTLKPGIVVRGRVTDATGKPVKDALILKGDADPYLSASKRQFLTDADGRFRTHALPPGETMLTVVAP